MIARYLVVDLENLADPGLENWNRALVVLVGPVGPVALGHFDLDRLGHLDLVALDLGRRS